MKVKVKTVEECKVIFPRLCGIRAVTIKNLNNNSNLHVVQELSTGHYRIAGPGVWKIIPPQFCIIEDSLQKKCAKDALDEMNEKFSEEDFGAVQTFWNSLKVVRNFIERADVS